MFAFSFCEWSPLNFLFTAFYLKLKDKFIGLHIDRHIAVKPLHSMLFATTNYLHRIFKE